MEVSAVILAGGQASRMNGIDKGLVAFNGRSMVNWTVDVVRPLVKQLIISCNRNMTDYMPLADSIVCDRLAGSLGPLAGVHAAMEVIECSSLLVLPCDTPLMSASLITRLLDVSEKNPTAIVVLSEGDFLQPLHAVIPSTLKESLELYLIGDGRAVRKWYSQHEVIKVQMESSEKTALANINTQDDIESYGAD